MSCSYPASAGYPGTPEEYMTSYPLSSAGPSTIVGTNKGSCSTGLDRGSGRFCINWIWYGVGAVAVLGLLYCFFFVKSPQYGLA